MNPETRRAIEAHLDLLLKEIEAIDENRRRIRCQAHVRSIKELLVQSVNDNRMLGI